MGHINSTRFKHYKNEEKYIGMNQKLGTMAMACGGIFQYFREIRFVKVGGNLMD